MANSQSSNKKQINQSGLSRVVIPKILPYPQLLPLTDAIRHIFCYVIKQYKPGISCLIYRQPQIDQVMIVCGDWNGNHTDVVGNDANDLAAVFIQDHVKKFVELMSAINLSQAQFFFGLEDNELVLVDVQLAMNKFAGPGMLNDLFSRIFRTQEVKTIKTIDDVAIEYIDKNTGDYNGDIVLKPSKFRMYDLGSQQFTPFYVGVKR